MYRINKMGELEVCGFGGWFRARPQSSNRVRGLLALRQMARRRDGLGAKARGLCLRLYGTTQP